MRSRAWASEGIRFARPATFRSLEEWLDQEGWWLDQTWVADWLKWRGWVSSSEYAHYCNDWDGLPMDETCLETDTCVDMTYPPGIQAQTPRTARSRSSSTRSCRRALQFAHSRRRLF